MRNIVGKQIHDEIIGLIDRAERVVILVSPFVRVWPDFTKALARAVSRGVSITLITRGPRERPSARDLDIFEQLEAEIMEVPVLHLKAYLSEKEALHTSVNLTRSSVGRSVESSLLFDRELDPEGWAQVFEIWQKVVDDHERENEQEPTDFDAVVAMLDGDRPSLREQADAGESGARDAHRYCISCGETCSHDGDEVTCLRCRAAAMANGRRPDDIVGKRCTRCNWGYSGARVHRPFCEACYQESRRRYTHRTARWFVAGARESIEAWWRYEDQAMRKRRLGDVRLDALARRWVVLSPGAWVSATVTGSTTAPLDLWAEAGLHRLCNGKVQDGLVVERVPSVRLPPCRELPGFDPTEALHAVYLRHSDARTTSLWRQQTVLASWKADLSRSDNPHVLAAPDWQWKALLGPRRAFSPDLSADPDRVHLLLDIELGAPDDLRKDWLRAVDHLVPHLLAALHSFSRDEARELVGDGDSKGAQAITEALTRPAPLGLATLVRSGNGKVQALPARRDRLVAVRASVVAGEGWHLRASVSTAQKAPVH